ncbi:hypothetical protein LWI29_022086 [Acer saccharum]|uniref:Pentatricopeptide repeat-containing protein n=1 Tax=Acer saccharum TaxID=4024 RepID=A0AA39W620_ACESA|nr:hypothetical protein LWI29_022086 [Acer saccharum]
MGTTLVQICSSVTTLTRARQLHAIILTTATFFDVQSPYLHNNVLSMYGRCGALRDARQVFDRMPKRSLVSYNTLISACSRDPDYASLGFRLMTQKEFECMRPNGSTFTSLIQSVLLLEDQLMGSLLHTQVKKFGFLDDICVQTSLLGMYSNCGDLVSATKMFSCIGDKDAVAWNSIILGNLKNDKIREGLYLFNAMVRSGVTPTKFTYSMVLNGCSRMGDYSSGKLVHARVIISNIVADLPLENALLDMYCNCSDTKTAVRASTMVTKRDPLSLDPF